MTARYNPLPAEDQGGWRVAAPPSKRTYSVFRGDEYVAGGFWTREAAEAEVARRQEAEGPR